MPQQIAIVFFLLTAFLLMGVAAAETAGQAKHPLAGVEITLPEPPEDGTVDLPRFPSMSPDGASVCFSWRGDLWKVPAQGGTATRLTAHPMDDDLSAWSPDGKQIAFNSMRSGYRNVYTMNAEGAGVRTVTREDRSHFISGWADSETILMSAWREADVHRNPRPYQVAVDGGPITRLHAAFGRAATASPDGRYVAFVRGRASWVRAFTTNSDTRDIWLYDNEDQSFRQLTANPGNDGMPKWLDNETIVYLSARPPARVNLYRLNINEQESQAEALTAFKGDDVQHFDVARQAGTAVLHVWDRLYTLDLKEQGAEPMAMVITGPTDTGDRTIVKELTGNAKQAALSPDGKVMAVSIHGELFVRTLDSENPGQRITRGVALDHQPVWSPDGQTLYFTSDRDGTLSIYQASVTLTRGEIESALRDEPGEDAEAEGEAIELHNEADLEDETQSEAVEESGAEEDGETPTDEADEQDKRDEQEEPVNRWHDAVRFEVTPVVRSAAHDSDPSPSPDGQTLAFRRGNGTLMLLDLESGQERVYAHQWDDGLHWAWSGDSRYLAVSYEDQDHNADIWVGPADASTPPVNITKHPAMDRLPSFSHDGKVLTFVSARVDDQYDIYAVYLDKALESYTPQQFADYYKEASERVKKLKPLSITDASGDGDEDQGVKEADEQGADADSQDAQPAPLDLEDAYRRLRRLTRTPESEWDVVLHPSGARVVYTRDEAAYAIGWDGEDEKKLAADFDIKHLSLNGAVAVGIYRQTASTVSTNGGEVTQVKVNGSIRVDRQAMQRQRFTEASRAVSMNFYDGSFKGIDWPGATVKYAQLASRTTTPSEFDDVANRYLGLLDASHMSIRSPRPEADNSHPNGRLGAAYERVDEGYKVVAIEPNTPAASGPMKLMVGDTITAIDFEPVDQPDTIASRLVGRIGQETAVTVLRMAEGDDQPQTLHLLVTPISYNAYADIRYDNWQLSRKALVTERSDGRLGYIHIESMNAASLAEYERELYAACEGKDGLIIDVRDNGGGWTTDLLLASIMTARHAYTVPRGADPERTNSYPIPRLFIPRYNLPMNALCNENSFSNAEIFSHAFKTLERGTLVGNTTGGGVISTGRTRLLDGTSIRLPFRGWFLPDGTDMENNGAEPDLIILQTPEQESSGEDAQLEAAVADLLKRL